MYIYVSVNGSHTEKGSIWKPLYNPSPSQKQQAKAMGNGFCKTSLELIG